MAVSRLQMRVSRLPIGVARVRNGLAGRLEAVLGLGVVVGRVDLGLGGGGPPSLRLRRAMDDEVE